MRVACFIPIKANSERIPGKNFKQLNNKKLYEYIIEHTLKAECFDDIFVDTNSEEITRYAEAFEVKTIKRLECLAENTANGNDLLVYHHTIYPDYDYYFQLFATAPFLQPETIRSCVNKLTDGIEYDSCFTAIKHNGFFWLNKHPVNYQPYVLPRSQDLEPVSEETTGLYGITKESLEKYRCRIGRNPYIYYVDKFEAVDINNETDFKIAEIIGKKWGEGYDLYFLYLSDNYYIYTYVQIHFAAYRQLELWKKPVELTPQYEVFSLSLCKTQGSPCEIFPYLHYIQRLFRIYVVKRDGYFDIFVKSPKA